MKHLLVKSFVIFAVFAVSALGQQRSGIMQVHKNQVEIDEIIAKFTQNEKAFRDALTNYVFDRSATIQTIGMGGQVTGVYRRDSFMTFSDDGRRFERITYAPVSTLQGLNITKEDLEDLGGVNPFALEPHTIPNYTFRYVGKEKIDDLELYVFDVHPKTIPSMRSGIRVFTGRVWVDDHDLMVVKSKGKALPEDKNNKYPIVETWRENVDGKYWFPAYSFADDTLVFDRGFSVRMQMKVTYKNYRLGRTDVRILDDEEVIVDDPKPSPSPTPRKP
jgi:hypothetical protein